MSPTDATTLREAIEAVIDYRISEALKQYAEANGGKPVQLNIAHNNDIAKRLQSLLLKR